MECPLKTLKGKRWERRKDARPQELLAAALDLFVERGYTAAKLDEVAARAGVSKGTLYLYFANKEDLFKAVIRESMMPVLDEADEIIDRHEGHSADLFREIMMGWWERIGNTPLAGITKLMMAEAGNFPEVAKFFYEEVVTRRNAMLVRMLERGIARGEFRPIDVQQTINVVAAPMVMLMLWNNSFGACHIEPIDPEAYLQSCIDLLLNGLVQEPAAARHKKAI